MSEEVIASGGEAWITELDNDQLLDLFRLSLSETAVYAITTDPAALHGSTPLMGTTELDAQSTHHNLHLLMGFDRLFHVFNRSSAC
jgi:hypothetical protein